MVIPYTHVFIKPQEMKRLLDNTIMDESTHAHSSMFVLTVIAHGDQNGFLWDINREPAWNRDMLVAEVCDVEALRGKPKLFFFQSCRGGE